MQITPWTRRMLHGTLAALSLAAFGCSAAPVARHFEVRHDLVIDVPPHAKLVRAWFALPQETESQLVSRLEVRATAPVHQIKDQHGNRYLYLEANNPGGGPLEIATRFDLTRFQQLRADAGDDAQPLTSQDRLDQAKWLESSRYVVTNDAVRGLAREIIGSEKNPFVAGQRVYDWMVSNVEWWVKDPAQWSPSSVGSSQACFEQRAGSDADMHSLYAALCRAADIPARVVYGSLLKEPLDGEDIDQSQHAWVEFYAPPVGWIPADVALADLHHGEIELDSLNAALVMSSGASRYTGSNAEKVEFYCGNLDARRIHWSTGRDVTPTPAPEHSPLDSLPQAHVEINGQVWAQEEGWKRKLTFREIPLP